MRNSLFIITILIVIFTACAPVESAATEELSYPGEPSYPSDGSTNVPAELTSAELAVLQQLAANLGLQESDITLVSSEVTEFSDACLGVAMEGVMCAQVITPGRTMVLEADGLQYEYRTSEDGSRVQPATLAMVWKREGGIAGFCDTLTVFRSGEVLTNNCNGQSDGKMGTIAGLLTTREQTQFKNWIAEFEETKLDASDPKGVADRMVVTLEFFGSGTQQPAESEEQALFSFAQNLYQELAR